MDDGKNLLRRDTFVLRAIYIVFTSMIVLAFIVIGFVAETWGSIPERNKHFALVVVNASGAHFFMTLLFVLPSMALWRWRPSRNLAIALTLGGITYIYVALILQHWGIARSLLSEKWSSIFPFGAIMIDLADNSPSHFYFYFLPILAAWAVLGVIAGVLTLTEFGRDYYQPKPVANEVPPTDQAAVMAASEETTAPDARRSRNRARAVSTSPPRPRSGA